MRHFSSSQTVFATCGPITSTIKPQNQAEADDDNDQRRYSTVVRSLEQLNILHGKMGEQSPDNI